MRSGCGKVMGEEMAREEGKGEEEEEEQQN